MDHDHDALRRYGERYEAEHQKAFSFEAVLSATRRAQAIRYIQEHPHRSVLEIGCGPMPLFTDVVEYEQYVVVEPITAFAANAAHIAERYPGVTVIEGFIEHAAAAGPIKEMRFDCIILSGVLHEVPDPVRVLRAIGQLSGRETTVYISTPNMKSVHRLLAREMGLISDIAEPSALDIRFSRPHRFHRQSLCTLLENHGFEVLRFATYFIKPFTNEQMEAMIDQGIVDRSIVQGLERLVRYMPDLGAEMYAVVRKKQEPPDPV